MRINDARWIGLTLAICAAPLLAQQPPAVQANPAPGCTATPAQLEVVTAECDIVTVVHKNYRQDPTAEPGKFYEVFTFDTFRVRNGKLVEHWDGAVINPPAGRGQ